MKKLILVLAFSMIATSSYAALDLSEADKAVQEYNRQVQLVQLLLEKSENMKNLLVKAVKDQQEIINSYNRQLDNK